LWRGQFMTEIKILDSVQFSFRIRTFSAPKKC
jgi:hypothetical protein